MGFVGLVDFFENLSIRRKVLYSTIVMLVFIGIVSGLAHWFIVIPSVIKQIQIHSLRVGYSLVTRCRPHILAGNRPVLTGILFQKKVIEADLSYIFITDNNNRLLAHTFIGSIPEGIETANLIGPEEDKKINLINVGGESVYDAAVFVKEGLENIGTVHIGVGKKPVDALTLNIGIIFIVVMVGIILVAGLLSNLVAAFISRPLSSLTQAMNDLCLARTDHLPLFSQRVKCWDILKCKQDQCPAFKHKELVCWFADNTLCHSGQPARFPEKMEDCYNCEVYKRLGGDEIVQLSNSFNNIIYTMQLKTKELKLSEEKYRLLFNYDPNPLFMVDVESAKILDANSPASDVYQYEHKELLEMSFLDLFDPEDANRLWKELQRFVKDEYVFMPKLWARKKDGHYFFLDFHARVGKFQELESRSFGLSYIIRTVDITRRLEREAQLTQASKMATLGEMATGIAHELNQPLNVIRVGADFFAKMTKRGEKISDDQLSNVSRNINDQVDRAANIINHLREFGRRTDFKSYPVDINEPIQDVFTILGQQLKLRDIEASLKLAEGLPKILADKNRLEQIFLNLVTNARDAMEAKAGEAIKKLTIATYEQNGRVVALVSDTGMGISEAVREKIFEPFFTTKEVGKGTGLGLSITYRLVKDFGGDIDIKLTSDIGTIFKLSFPIYTDEDHIDDKTSTH
ncbi:MAG: PAS domain S-box protein [Desulfobacterales bacterium]|nr:PAS domain S-box protein [Desulfobacterales bacterium]